MDRREFVEQYRQEIEPINFIKFQEETRPEQRRYTAQKGTMARANRQKRKPNMKLAALILAAAIGVSGITAINNHDTSKSEPVSIIELQQDGVNLQNLGLSVGTIELFEKYDEYFSNFDKSDKYHLTDEQILTMIQEIKEMHFSTVKEKMGNLVGEDSSNITMYYSFDNSDGHKHASVIINEDDYDREAYTNAKNLILPDKNKIPAEMVDIIWQLEDLNDLSEDVRGDNITKVNAIKQLRKLYYTLEKMAIGEFIQDTRGNISIAHYEKKQVEQQEERDERG